jgi:hypothetical protein
MVSPTLTCPGCHKRYRLVRKVRLAEPAAQPPKSAESGEVALAGADGRQAADLLRASKREGTERLTRLCQAAVKRLLRVGPEAVRSADGLFSDGELADLAWQLSATLATGTLLGRARVRLRQRKVEAGTRLFAEHPTPFAETFAEPTAIVPLPPEEALTYFRSLVPELGRDPRLTERLERQAFTLAVQTDEVVLNKVKAVLERGLVTGAGSAADIDAILDAAGVGPRRNGYSEMVWRTNLMDSYVQGSQRELMQPDVQEIMPVWRYLGVRDGREGDDHRPHFDLYFPSSVPFTRVRGRRAFNCRCAQAPVAAFEWAELQARGVRLAPGYETALAV